ncbi:Transcriptional regulator, TetR family [Labilithrix luteola]|uniref:Transcriptional regulator, TetR family n=1 Tax=Labilithrix luteola TaxID=1391654 RepID=A0A0K1PPP2_9BACT|nr:TetR/AcrR family transcriptional regulator [Labilithrix luteola]AKU95510.1 Transcriptional regulator, TetR family [Labilithrix luteola]
MEAGLELLSEQGKEAVSLREIARKCRVSPRAPYQHFADKTDFLAALAEEGFKEFGAAMARAEGDFSGLAQAYLDFAVRKPALMQLMFGDDFEDRAKRNPTLHDAALATFGQLEEQIARLHPDRDERSHRLLAVNAWALIHGLSELLRHGQLAHVLPGESSTKAVVDSAVELFSRADRGDAQTRRPSSSSKKKERRSS